MMKALFLFLIMTLFVGCKPKESNMTNIVFLHHSTGQSIWYGKTNRYIRKLTNRSDVGVYFRNYNRKNRTKYKIENLIFPQAAPYGWKNYPFDYYNIWVKNAGEQTYMNEPTLELLARDYDIVIFKHCYPVSNIDEDTGAPNIDSERKSLENYILQYQALKTKMHEFSSTKFIIWTPAVQVKNNITTEEAQRTKQFVDWIKNKWDEPGDNIFVWDFYQLETEGGLYMADRNAAGPSDSHPTVEFAARVAPLFAQFIIDVAEGIHQ